MILSVASMPSIPGSSRSIVTRSGSRRGSLSMSCSAVSKVPTISRSGSRLRKPLQAAANAFESSHTAIRLGRDTLTADQALDHLEERLLVVFLLDDVSVCALLGSAALLLLPTHRGDHDHRQRVGVRVLPNRLEQLETVHRRHL